MARTCCRSRLRWNDSLRQLSRCALASGWTGPRPRARAHRRRWRRMPLRHKASASWHTVYEQNQTTSGQRAARKLNFPDECRLVSRSTRENRAGNPRSALRKRRKSPGCRSTPGLSRRAKDLEVHAAHATGRVARGCGRLLRLVGDDRLGGQEQRRDGRRVLQRRAGDLDRVGNAGLQQVLVLTAGGVEAGACGRVANLLGDNAGLQARVEGDLLQRGLEGDANDVRTRGLVTGELQLLQRRGRLQQSHAATGDDALLDGGLGVADRVLDAVLALLELHLGGGAGLDHRNTAGQLGQALLQLLAVVVGVAVLDLLPDLCDPARDGLAVSGTLDDRGLVLGDDDLAGAAQQRDVGGLQGEADLFADDLTTGKDGHVLQHRLAAVTEARRLDRDALEGAADLVDDQGRERLALDVLADDDELFAALHDLLQDRKQVLDGADLAVDVEDVGLVDDGFHPLRVGDEVRRDVALVEAHTFDELELEAEGVGLLDGDDAFLADLVHGLGDHVADGLVAGRDRGGRSDLLLGLDVLGLLGQLLADALDGVLDATLQRHRVGAGGDVAQTLADECLGEDGRGGGAVTGDVVGLLGDLFDELGTDLLERVLELDLLGDGHAVVGDRGGAPLLLQHDVATLGAERHLDRVGQLVHATLEGAASVLVERDDLGHPVGSSRGTAYLSDRRTTPATDGSGAWDPHPRPGASSYRSVTRLYRVLTPIFSTRPGRVQSRSAPG